MTIPPDARADSQTVTEALRRWSTSQVGSSDEVFALVYSELKSLASKRLRSERRGHSLHTMDLVHEAYMRLEKQRDRGFNDRGHFFAIAAQAMRRVLLDHARKHGTAKRIGHQNMVPLEDAPGLAIEPDLDVLALDEALTRLAKLDAQQAQVVELRYFAGLGTQEVADVLGISRTSVWRDWKAAKLWMRREMDRGAGAPATQP